MKAAILLAVAIVLFVAVLKWRIATRRARVGVMSRMHEERSAIGVVSPTEDLFRSEGVPVTDDLRRGLATAPPSEPKLSAAIAGAVSAVKAAVATDPPLADAAAGAAAPMPPLARTDLMSLFEGIRLPCDLAPITVAGGGAGGPLGFATLSSWASEVRDRLQEAVAAIGGTLSWVDANTALVRRDAGSALVTVYEQPHEAVDPSGRPLFPTTSDGQLAVKLTAA